MVKIYGLAILLASGWLFTVAVVAAQEADPTRPAVRVEQLSQSAEELRDYRLTSVWYRGSNTQSRSSAVINGQRYEQGDEVGPYVVEAIEPGQVLLKNDEAELWLQVFRSSQLTIEPSRS